ncbi:unnamed protein product [Calicophoron daubneyi]|uniref:Histone-lysine N-methyltransferase eggless n=1 Tax=Calicophoron daubneyi TaxID=300641 RepID=A0AAV2TZA7_CALDB
MNNVQTLATELTEVICSSFSMDELLEFVLSFIEERHKDELNAVTDPELKRRVLEDRLPSAFEECGLLDAMMKLFSDMSIGSRLDHLEKEKVALQSEIQKMNYKIDKLISSMTALQINSFGRVIRLFDNRIIDLAEDEDVEVIEKPTSRSVDRASIQSANSSFRTLQPSELLIGLVLTVSQPVLCRKGRHTWFPGRVSLCRPAPHALTEVAELSLSGVTRSINSSTDQIVYTITLDAPHGKEPEVCNATPDSIALAVSALELKQKYPVGARVVSIYRDDDGGIGYYSGLIAEPPSERNNHRYLLFFDDGYTQYSPPGEIYRICSQSKENWKQASEGSQDFIKRYLAQYPQRPMVRLKPGQLIETELDGDWIKATVVKVDASLALLHFSSSHSEWIYRGSTRLEPLYSETHPDSNRMRGSRNQRVEVQYNSVDASLSSSAPSAKLRSVRKSATGNTAPTAGIGSQPKPRSPTPRPASDMTRERKPLDDHSNSSSATTKTTAETGTGPSGGSSTGGGLNPSDLENSGIVVPYLDHLFADLELRPYVPHKCDSSCLIYYNKKCPEKPVSENPFDYKGLNPLEIPFHCGWLRYLMIGYPRECGRQVVVYNAPCGRQLRSMHEVQRFLDKTDSQLTTELFSFDCSFSINREFHAEKTLTNITDLSYGKENVPVPCVNSVDNEVPGYIDYIPNRQPVGNVPLVEDPNFIVCCDCTDNCRDRTKCSCQQLTAEASSLTNPGGIVDSQAGYHYRRLSQFTVGGIYECNSQCKCDRRCSNRVVQQGLWTRLQVFKTSRKGWGIRALNPIPKGTFLCTYAGAIYDEAMAVQQGFDFGDEYQADLDYIETVEKPKEGYESSPEDPDNTLSSTETSKPFIRSQDQNRPKKDEDETEHSPDSSPEKRKSQAAIADIESDGHGDTCSGTSSSVSEANLNEIEEDCISHSSERSTVTSHRNLFVALDCLPKNNLIPSHSSGDKKSAPSGNISRDLSKVEPVTVEASKNPNPGKSPNSETHTCPRSLSNLASAACKLSLGPSSTPTRVQDTDLIEILDSPEAPRVGDHSPRVSLARTEKVSITVETSRESISGEPAVEASNSEAGSTINSVVLNTTQAQISGGENSDRSDDTRGNENDSNRPFSERNDTERCSSIIDESQIRLAQLDLTGDNSLLATKDFTGSASAAQFPGSVQSTDHSDCDSDESKVNSLTSLPSPATESDDTTPASTTRKSVEIRNFAGLSSPESVAMSGKVPSSSSQKFKQKPEEKKSKTSKSKKPHGPRKSVTIITPLSDDNDTDVSSPAQSRKKSVEIKSFEEVPDSGKSETLSLNSQGVNEASLSGSKLEVIRTPGTKDESDSVCSAGIVKKSIEIKSFEELCVSELVINVASSAELKSVKSETSEQKSVAKRSHSSGKSKRHRKYVPSFRFGLMTRFRAAKRRLKKLESKRLARERFRNRSRGLPPEFKHFRNAHELIRQADFSRSLRIELSPVKAVSLPAPDSETDRRLKRLARRRERNRLARSLASRQEEVKSTGVETSTAKSSDTAPSQKVEDSRPPQASDGSPAPHSPLTLRLRRLTSRKSGLPTFETVPSRPSMKKSGEESPKRSASADRTVSDRRYPKRELRRGEKKEKTPEEDFMGKHAEMRSSRSRDSHRDSQSHRSREHHHHQSQQPQQPRKCYPVARDDWLLARTYFQDENPYIMDAKKMGNLGRYFNHSCNPNVFVQNVFIESHDPRFPEVAFFTKRNIEAGEEMTWDYGYTVDAVPFKVLYCYCGEPNCRIRLL